MAIELNEQTIEASKVLYGNTNSIELSAGQGIRVQTGTLQSPDTQLMSAVPAGKQWSIYVYVKIIETDV